MMSDFNHMSIPYNRIFSQSVVCESADVFFESGSSYVTVGIDSIVDQVLFAILKTMILQFTRRFFLSIKDLFAFRCLLGIFSDLRMIHASYHKPRK